MMLFISILGLLISNAVTTRRDKSILYSRISMIILFSCILLCLNSFYLKFHGTGIGLYGGLYHSSVISHVFQMFGFIITFIILQLNSFYPVKVMSNSSASSVILGKLQYFNFLKINRTSQQYKIIEYPLIILFVVIGGAFLMSCSDLISIFLCIELQSYALYILCAVYRDSERAVSGGLTYFLLGGLSSCFILLGSGLFYSFSGNTSFDGLYTINHISCVDSNWWTPQIVLSLYNIDYINFSLTILSIGFLFKISAAPFHFWSPDVYDAIPTVVTTFVAVFAKISIFILLLELVHYTSNIFVNQHLFEEINLPILDNYGNQKDQTTSWTFALLISGLFSLIIGSVLGLTQFRIKRLYAYSTISHLGFILLALTINSIESVQSFIFYLMQYSLSNLNAFVILIAIGYYLYQYSNKDINSDTSERNNSPVQLITDIKGFFYINPMLSLSLAITLFSFVGVPPLIGFFAKQMVLTSALDNGYVFMSLIAILTSVISAVYYLVLVRQVFFDQSDKEVNPTLSYVTVKDKSSSEISNNTSDENKLTTSHSIHLSDGLTGAISLLTLITLFFMIVPQEWLNMTTILSLIIFNC